MDFHALRNGFWTFTHALNYKLFGRRVPVMVSIGLTDRCNLRCPFCYVGFSAERPREYSKEELFGYIDAFAAMGTRIFLLQGGEPLMHKDLGEIIRHIKRKGRYCRISTNGVFVRDHIESLKGIDQVSFSLDGGPEVADRIRGKGVYAKVVAGMEAAHAAGIPFEIHASLIRESASDHASVQHILGLARRFGTHASFCITAVSGAENTREVGSGEMEEQEIRSFIHYLMELKRQGHPVSNSFNSLRKSLRWPISFGAIGFPENLPSGHGVERCLHGHLICWLFTGDTLYSCPTMFNRPEFAAKVEHGDVAKAWKELGERRRCLACGNSDESTTLLSLRGEDVLEAARRLLAGGKAAP